MMAKDGMNHVPAGTARRSPGRDQLKALTNCWILTVHMII